MTVLSIEGPAGAGKKIIGSKVAEKLHLDYVDRLILSDVAKDIGVTVEAISDGEKTVLDLGEKLARALQRILDKSTITSAAGDPYFGPSAAAFLPDLYDYQTDAVITDSAYLQDNTYFESLKKILTKYVDQGNGVLMGRGGNLILKDRKEVFNIGIIANMEKRKELVSLEKSINLEEAEEELVIADKARADRYRRLFNIENCDDPMHYDIVINTGCMDIDSCVDVAVNATNNFTTSLNSSVSPIRYSVV